MVILMSGLFSKENEEKSGNPFEPTGGLFGGGPSSGGAPEKKFKKTSSDSGLVVLSISILLTALMIFLTHHLITPFAYSEYNVTADIVPVIFTYILEGLIVFFGIYTEIAFMKTKTRFKWSLDVPYITGVASSAIIIVNIILYYLGVNFNEWINMFGGYGLALIHAFTGTIAGGIALKKLGKWVNIFNITIVASIITIVYFVIAHLVIPNTGLSNYIMF